MAKKITKKRKPISKKIKVTKVVWNSPDWIDKELQNEDHSQLEAKTIEREFLSFAQVATKFTTKLDLLVANTVKLKQMMIDATKQIEEPLEVIQDVNEVFNKHL